MAKKSKKKHGFLLASGGDAWKNMSKMKYRDLQRNAIVRGMGFSEMVNSDIYSLQAWLAANWKIPIDTQKLDEFDYWREKSCMLEVT